MTEAASTGQSVSADRGWFAVEEARKWHFSNGEEPGSLCGRWTRISPRGAPPAKILRGEEDPPKGLHCKACRERLEAGA